MIYLDNAATTFKKPESVYKTFMSVWREYGANAGRGGHRLSLSAAGIIYSVQEKVSELFNIENPENIAFTQNATYAINMALKGILKPEDHVIITCLEHNSVYRPLLKVGCEYSIAIADETGSVGCEQIEKLIKKNTRLIAVNHASNVCKSVCDIEKIGALAKKHSILFLVDSAQSAGVLNIDVQKMNIDILCFTGHKSLFGPQGTGGIYLKENIACDSFAEGGSGSDSLSGVHPRHMPDLLTAGTQNTPGIAALGAGIDFIKKQGIENILNHENMLLSRFCEKTGNICGVKLYTPCLKGTNLLSINLKNKDCVRTGEILEKEFNILTRSGYHCAPLCHKMLSTYDTGGTIRFSFGYFNTKADCDRAAMAIKKISENFVYKL